jgi:hypothetical protein
LDKSNVISPLAGCNTASVLGVPLKPVYMPLAGSPSNSVRKNHSLRIPDKERKSVQTGIHAADASSIGVGTKSKPEGWGREDHRGSKDRLNLFCRKFTISFPIEPREKIH